jgi:hypothetical protein
VTFSADVSGVSGTTVRVNDSAGTAVAATLACRASTGAVVACTSGSVRSVSLTPNAALIPGETYAVSVTRGVSASGVAATPASRSFRASTSEQENSLRAGFAWSKARANSAYGHSYLVESHRGATLQYTFSGRRVTWYTRTGPAEGVAKVFVDGVRKGKVDNYTSATKWKVARALNGLSAGQHTLQVVVSGKKNARSSGTNLVVDAVRVGKSLRKSPVAAMTWRHASSAKASGHAYSLASTKAASTSFTFRGTAVSWSTRTARSMGKAKVYVDGVLKARVDNYSARSRWNVVRTVSGLTDRVHTVKVVVLGTKRPAARGTSVVVDRWTVR